MSIERGTHRRPADASPAYPVSETLEEGVPEARSWRASYSRAEPGRPSLLPSWFIAGFECSSHLRADGTRLDLLETTGHARLALDDYRRAAGVGMTTVRDGVRWHLIEERPGQYRWDSWLPMIRAAQEAGVTVIWDLCHYGWPEHLNVWSPEFPSQVAAFARACVEQLLRAGCHRPFLCPINEVSYLAWAGGEVGLMNPAAIGQGVQLKQQLLRAYCAAVKAIRSVEPHACIVSSEPLIHVTSGGGPEAMAAAEHYRLAQFETVDHLEGKTDLDLGGHPSHLDVIGVNFYPDNQWYHQGSTIPFGHHAYRPLSDMLLEVYHRYRKPLLISETGAEGSARAPWLDYVCAEVEQARSLGVPMQGICLYPILDYAGWNNDRLCRVGLWSQPNGSDRREIHEPLLQTMRSRPGTRPSIKNDLLPQSDSRVALNAS